MVIKYLLRAALRPVRKRRHQKAVEALSNADALLISHVKCGRTWVRFALSSYFADAFDLGIEPDLRSTFSIVPNLDHDPVRGIPTFQFSSRRPQLPLIFASHQPSTEQLAKMTPIVFVVRDPRDIIVSAYFHASRHKRRFAGDIDTFIENELQNLISYFNQWADTLEHRAHHVTSYERFSADAALELRRILVFLGIQVDDLALQRAVQRSRFSEMQSEERRTGLPGHHYDIADDESLRVRKGRVGGYKDYLSPEQERHIVTRCGEGLTASALRLLADFSAFVPPATRRIYFHEFR